MTSLQGIEALEYWLDPDAASKTSSSTDPTTEDPLQSSTTPSPSVPDPQANDPHQPKVFCRKGKCYPYDPDKINPNVNLEMKPGTLHFKSLFQARGLYVCHDHVLLSGMILTASETNVNQRKGKRRAGNRFNEVDEENEEEGNMVKNKKGDRKLPLTVTLKSV